VKKTTWLGILFGALVLGYIFFSTMKPPAFRCQVCITFKGQRNCADGAADQETGALRTATMTACSTISGGVIEANQCENTPPDSLKWLARK
jgi:hypothetical protein